MTLLMPRQVDGILRYPRGRSLKLARADKLPHVVLPDGEIRFDADAIEEALRAMSRPPMPLHAPTAVAEQMSTPADDVEQATAGPAVLGSSVATDGTAGR